MTQFLLLMFFVVRYDQFFSKSIVMRITEACVGGNIVIHFINSLVKLSFSFFVRTITVTTDQINLSGSHLQKHS